MGAGEEKKKSEILGGPAEEGVWTVSGPVEGSSAEEIKKKNKLFPKHTNIVEKSPPQKPSKKYHTNQKIKKERK